MLLNEICTNFAWQCTVSDLTGYETDHNIEKDKEEKDAVIQDRKKQKKKKTVNTKFLCSEGVALELGYSHIKEWAPCGARSASIWH